MPYIMAETEGAVKINGIIAATKALNTGIESK